MAFATVKMEWPGTIRTAVVISGLIVLAGADTIRGLTTFLPLTPRTRAQGQTLLMRDDIGGEGAGVMLGDRACSHCVAKYGSFTVAEAIVTTDDPMSRRKGSLVTS
jgi:hypothetical protein